MFEVLTRIYSRVQRLWIISTNILQGVGGGDMWILCGSYLRQWLYAYYVHDS